MDGIRTKYFQLNSYDNSLDLAGSINLSSGKIIIQIESQDSGQIFSTNEYTANGNVTIHIGNLYNQKNINMNVIGENAKGFSLKLTSIQKLVLDKEHPAKPDKSLTK